MASAIASRLDGLSEITELERIPLPYKTLYHTLVFKNDMPVDLLKERHQTGTQQLLIWIQAALKLIDTVVESQLLQRSQRQEEHLELLDDDEAEDQEELEIEIQDMVSGFGHYEPTIESSIEILLQLEECISNRTSTSNTPKEPTSSSSLSIASSSLSLSSTTSLSGYTPPATHLSPEIEQVMEQWSRLRGIVGGLGGSIREHQRIRDGIQSINNIAEQTYQATQLLEKCLKAIAQDKQNCRHAFEEGLTNLETKGGLDGNDMLELDSMVGLLSLQIESLQTSFPECVSAKNNKSHPYNIQAQSKVEHGSLAHKKTIMAALYQDLLVDWNSLRRRKEQLWRDLEECDRWRARIEKMARQIESMLEPVEIFHKMCANLLGSLEEKNGSQQHHLMVVNEEDQEVQSPKPESLSSWPSIPIEEPSQADLEMLVSTLQELEEKQNMVAPAIENMFWVQEGEIQHRTKHVVHSPSTPSTAVPSSLPNSPMDTFAGSPLDFSSPLYPNLPMLERQHGLKARWSNLKTSLDTAGIQLQQHHATMTERANTFLAMKQRQAEEAAAARAAEEKARISTEVSEPSTPTLRRSFTNSSERSSSVMSPSRNSSTRILRGTLVPSISMDSPTVKKYMLLKGDKPTSSKPRPWCPSINTQSPGLPGFPVQTSSWGYFLISTSQSMDSFGSVIATPAPVPIAPPPAPTPPPPKFNRPPFSPAGPRRYTKPTPPPTRPAPQRSVSVAGGDYNRNRCMSPTISWENKMVRRSNSMAFDDKSSKGTNRNTRQGNNNSQKKSGRKGSFSSAKDGSSSAARASRRSSNASECSAWYGNHHRHSVDNSSSEDETVTGEFHTNNRMSQYKSYNKQGLRARTKQNDSSSSLDSMMSSSVNSYGGRGYSSLSSHGELRSPSPPLPLPYPSAFGSSFAAARSTAALHTALLSSMSSHSSSSFRNSALSFSSSQRTDSRQSDHDGALSSKHSSGSLLLSRRQVYHHDDKPSSWLGSGSLISALSFRVPTYTFEEDFGSFEATAHEGAVVN
ncbi:hypothetical protein BG003_008931 [Podila horticola]|nr:hypothetical protein BG003_008931 [Podila horticola]